MAQPTQQISNVETISGKVKKVLSSDTLAIWTFKPDGTPGEIVVHLANLIAPKVAAYSSDMKQVDEPYGWKARETLRRELVGLNVTCEVEHRSPKAVFCHAYKGTSTEGESLNESIVARGLANVKDVNKKNEKYDKLKELVEQAKTKKLGIWSDEASTSLRKIVWQVNDVSSFIAKYKRKPLKAVVEAVHPNACGVRAFVFIDGSYYYLTVNIAGIRGPTELSQLRPRAIYYLEMGLLQKDVEITLDGAGNNGQLFGGIGAGEVAIGLVENGFAQTQEWSLSSMDPAFASKFRNAEKNAKQKRVGIWKDYQEPAKPAVVPGKNSAAKVVEIVSADMLVIKEGDTLKKIFLSSIKPPRKDQPGKESQGKVTMAQRMYQQPLLFQAREFLRTLLIGETVQVQVDYTQPKSEQFPEKVCCTVMYKEENVAEKLVAAGLATVIRYRQDNDQRSSHYMELQEAESRAIQEQVGVHAKKDPEPMRVADLQGDLIKSKQYFTSLQRGNPNSGIVEFVSSGSRLRVYCPKHNCVFPLLLNGIQCPRSGRLENNGMPAQKGEPYGDEAMHFTRDLCLQHQIEMEIESQDKNGAMIGMATVDGKKNLSVELVKAGLASVHHYSAEKTRYYSELKKAEEAAKAKKLRIWENFVESTHEETVVPEVQEDTKSSRKIDPKNVMVSEVTSSVSKFYVQFNQDGPKLEELQDKLQKELKSSPGLVPTFKRGDRAVAKFLDGNWYRVRIERIIKGVAELIYVDYGNRGECEVSKLQSLPAGFNAPDFAHPCNLAFVKMPKDEDELASARKTFSVDVANAELKMNFEYEANGEKYVTLKAGDVDIGKALITDGFAYFEPRKGERYRKICEEYEKAQEEAKTERRNLWEYGDAREDEEDRK